VARRDAAIILALFAVLGPAAWSGAGIFAMTAQLRFFS
jgi:hypothetical protein